MNPLHRVETAAYYIQDIYSENDKNSYKKIASCGNWQKHSLFPLAN